jgi:1,4-dihydroxy-2-naphthoate polyprenyltransferase
MKVFLYIFRLIRPIYLLGGLILYTLGAGMARYLGEGLDWSIFWIGCGWVAAMQLAAHLLNEYYDAPGDSLNPNRTSLTGGSGAVGDDKISQRSVLFLSFACLAVVAMLSVVIIGRVKPEPSTYLMMALGFLGGFFYSTPPLKLETSGYGELTASFLAGFLVPAFAFSMQAHRLDRMVLMVTFPLVVLALGMFIALELPDFVADLKSGKRTLTVRLDWKSAMNLHNILILASYLLIGMASFFGMPRFVALTAMLTLPVGLLQIWQMIRIGQGGKPNWNALTINAVATFGLMIYFLTYSFWTH